MSIRSLVRRVLRRGSLERRLAGIEANLRDLNIAAERSEASVNQLVDVEVPGLFTMTESRLRAEMQAVGADARAHTEAAAAASQQAALAAAIEHANAAVDVAQRHVLKAAREHAEAASGRAQRVAVEHAEAAAEETRSLVDDRIERALAQMQRSIAALRRDLSHTAATSLTEHPAPAAPAVDRSIDPAFYAAFEDRFRGDPSLITARQQIYVPLVEHLVDDQHPVVDLGCGRGEWLALLRGAGVAAIGVDTNWTFVDEGTQAGLPVVHGDLVAYLRDAGDQSAGAITMFQVLEHLPFATVLEVIGHCPRVLQPGGVLIAEVPNTINLRVAATSFWLDPTHQRPLHPDLLQFVAAQCGFSKVDGWFVNPVEEQPAAGSDGPGDRRLFDLLDGPGDFSLVAWA